MGSRGQVNRVAGNLRDDASMQPAQVDVPFDREMPMVRLVVPDPGRTVPSGLTRWLAGRRGGPVALAAEIRGCDSSEELGRIFMHVSEMLGFRSAALGSYDSPAFRACLEAPRVEIVYFAFGERFAGEDSNLQMSIPAGKARAELMPLLENGFLCADGLAEVDSADILAMRAIFGDLLARMRQLLHTRLLAPLTRRQRECLRWTALGKTSGEIAGILGLSEHTINNYLASAAEKLGAVNKTHLVHLCLSGQAPGLSGDGGPS